MSIKTLIIFVAVYKEESITAVARKLSLSQPAVSAAIKELENYYSVRLFERMGRGIQKTNAAHHLYEFASHITSLYLEMDNNFKLQEQNSPLFIGSSISLGTYLIPELMKDYIDTFHVPYPYIKIDRSDIIEQMIIENELDLGLIEGPVYSDKILGEPFLNDPLILVCSPHHPLASKGIITLDDLKDEHFLLTDKNSETRKLAEAALLLHDFILKPSLESSSITAVINAVISNLGISILPKRLISLLIRNHILIELPVKEMETDCECHIIYHQNKFLNSDIIQFIEFIKNNTDAKCE